MPRSEVLRVEPLADEPMAIPEPTRPVTIRQGATQGQLITATTNRHRPAIKTPTVAAPAQEVQLNRAIPSHQPDQEAVRKVEVQHLQKATAQVPAHHLRTEARVVTPVEAVATPPVPLHVQDQATQEAVTAVREAAATQAVEAAVEALGAVTPEEVQEAAVQVLQETDVNI